ncbi:hypothetical protein A5694_15505 [Mycolicibacter sinensis]|nr:hypothetical protein A5694_15505 [Mycolicibacter sinensis]
MNHSLGRGFDLRWLTISRRVKFQPMELDEVSVTLFSRMDRVFLDDERDLPTVVIHDYRVTALHNSDRDQLCVGNHTIKARRWRRQSVGMMTRRRVLP